MAKKDEKRIKVGVLGAGPIAQAAHFESANKARNCDLYAICDVAPDLLDRMAIAHGAEKKFSDYAKMLEDPALDLVIIATADAFHVEASKLALAAGKHVLCEKPMGVGVEEAEDLAKAVKASGKLLQVGHMKRFDPGIESAKHFVETEMGEQLALKAWYCDSTHRYDVTDATQPFMWASKLAKKPSANPKADLKRYYMLAHGCHLIDLARHLCGDITELQTRLSERFGALCWFVDVAFANGAIGHLDLTISVRMDWHEGFQLYGQNGSVTAKIYNPWLYKASEVDIFHESTATTSRILGSDAHFYRRQLEAMADAIMAGKPVPGADVHDGIASVRAMVAIAQSAKTGKPVSPADVSGSV